MNQLGGFRCEMRMPGGGVGAAAFQTAGKVLKGHGRGPGVAWGRNRERALWLELNEQVGEGEIWEVGREGRIRSFNNINEAPVLCQALF